MTNLIGSEVEDYRRWLAVPGAAVHLYGKAAVRPGRKMGKVTQGFGQGPSMWSGWHRRRARLHDACLAAWRPCARRVPRRSTG